MILSNDPILIRSSKEPFGWMRNMCGFWKGEQLKIKYDDKDWYCTESLFQAFRFGNNPELVERIRTAGNGMASKRVKNSLLAAGHQPSHEPMSRKDVVAMAYVIKLKLKQHPTLLEDFAGNYGRIVIEDVSSRRGGNNLFWGAAELKPGLWVGENVLGNLYTNHLKNISIEAGYQYNMDYIDTLFHLK